jgi:hypothetical protein
METKGTAAEARYRAIAVSYLIEKIALDNKL